MHCCGTIASGPFPERGLILAATFIVITVTLLGQGAMLPTVIRWLGLASTGRAEAGVSREEERIARLESIAAVLDTLDRAAEGGTPAPVVDALRRHHEDRRTHLNENAVGSTAPNPAVAADTLRITLIDAERAAIARAYTENRLTDEARRRIERELDLELARVRESLAGIGDASIR